MACRCAASSSRYLRGLADALGELPRRSLASATYASSSFASTSTALWPQSPPPRSYSRAHTPARLAASPSGRLSRRRYATIAPDAAADAVVPATVRLTDEDRRRLAQQRNIGISAHIDSGKTTLTERVLFYTGRIKAIHEVRGKDQVGAKMDSMELEREKGITIQSAATYCDWPLREQVDPAVAGDYHINIIDTPGHVDFTIEVERALRVLDGAVLVLCAVSGVQSQTITVDRQMKRYKVPRVAFINKMDRQGANPWRVIKQLREKLLQPAAAMQVPMGAFDELEGVFDLVKWKAIRYEGESGIDVIESDDVSAEVLELAKQKRAELIETLADVDDKIADLFLEEKEITGLDIYHAVRRATISRRFMPVYMGTALGNKGVQSMLDGVCTYLPAPNEVDVSQLVALNVAAETETKHELVPTNKAPLVALAFKLEESKYGQLTYMRVYQGQIKRGTNLTHVRTGKKVKVPRLVRMHSNEMEEVQDIGAGEICALYGVDCATGDTFTDGAVPFSMTSMYVPEPVVSLSIRPKGSESSNFGKALSRFVREDPTFRVHVDAESSETIIRGMGELHLEIYVERMRREYSVETVTGRPQVNYREAILQGADFNCVYRRQSGGRGEFAKIIGRIEPIEGKGNNMEFVNETVGGVIDKGFMTATRKGFEDGMRKGELIGHPVENVRFVVTDGAMHPVDSSEFAFRTAGAMAFAEAMNKAAPVILEPIMKVAVTSPNEYQGNVISTISARKGTILDTEQLEADFTCYCEISLANMFGYITNLRAATQGKGEFTMEFDSYRPVTPDVQAQLMKEHRQFSGGSSTAGQANEKRNATSGKQGALRGF